MRVEPNYYLLNEGGVYYSEKLEGGCGVGGEILDGY